MSRSFVRSCVCVCFLLINFFFKECVWETDYPLTACSLRATAAAAAAAKRVGKQGLTRREERQQQRGRQGMSDRQMSVRAASIAHLTRVFLLFPLLLRLPSHRVSCSRSDPLESDYRETCSPRPSLARFGGRSSVSRSILLSLSLFPRRS